MIQPTDFSDEQYMMTSYKSKLMHGMPSDRKFEDAQLSVNLARNFAPTDIKEDTPTNHSTDAFLEYEMNAGYYEGRERIACPMTRKGKCASFKKKKPSKYATKIAHRQIGHADKWFANKQHLATEVDANDEEYYAEPTHVRFYYDDEIYYDDKIYYE